MHNFLKYMKRPLILAAGLMLTALLTNPALASGGGSDITSRIDLLIIQLSLITIAAWSGGALFERWKFPPVLGEILIGVLLGPYALGGIPFFGFSEGLFPLHDAFPVSIELYSFATIASIILLFFVGLETDLDTFLKFSVAGSVIGISGALVSFICGDIVGILYMQSTTGASYSFFHPTCLFFGVISTATSVGITARILIEKRRMNFADGVTTLSAAVIDDILGIIILAIVIGMSQTQNIKSMEIVGLAGKTLGIWLFFTVLGLAFSTHISNLLKKSKDRTSTTLLSFSLALLLAGIFEKSGLAMIIGAYTVGLVFSKTDLAFVIQERLDFLQRFFVPIFFCVMGMFINPKVLVSTEIMMFSLLYITLAIVGKFIGCYIPALACNFNHLGASRISVGMIPRGEVALIVASVGIAKGIITHDVFSLAVVMTFFTTLITPGLLNRLMSIDGPILRKNPAKSKNLATIRYTMPNAETAEFLHTKILEWFRKSGYHAHRKYHGLYLIRKNKSFITMHYSRHEVKFECLKKDETFVHLLFYEVTTELDRYMSHLQSYKDKNKITSQIFSQETDETNYVPDVFKSLSINEVEANLQGPTKEEIINNLLEIAHRSGQIKDEHKEQLFQEILQREQSFSTGMPDGLALPHIKSELVDRLVYVVGVSKNGVDFHAIDGNPSKIFIMTLVSQNHHDEYLENLSQISKYLKSKSKKEEILDADTNAQLLTALSS